MDLINKLKFTLKNLINKPFKIGLISYYYPSDKEKTLNGVGIHVYYLSRELAKLGCEVHVFAHGERDSTKENYIGDGKLAIHWISTKTKTKISDPVIAKRMSYFLFDNKISFGHLIFGEKFKFINTLAKLNAMTCPMLVK